MTETGWPLIPREVLPAPVPAAKRRPPPRPHTPDPGRQLPFFGAETTEPAPADLAGLLAGPGRLGRMGGTARVSVEVDAAWRVHVLIAELVSRGLTASWRPTNQDQNHEAGVRVDAHPVTHNAIQPVENRQEPESDPFDDVYPDPDAWPDTSPDSSAADDSPADDLVEDGRAVPPRVSAGRHLPVAGELSLTPAGRRAPTSEEESEKPDLSGQGGNRADPGVSGGPHRATPPVEPRDGEAAPKEAQEKETEADETGEDGTDGSTPEPAPRFEVLTAYSSRLNGLARGWPEATAQLFLSGPRLRLWVAAAGEPVPGGYALGLDPAKDVAAIDAALVRVGLAGRLSDDGRHYVIMGKRRLRRLAELVGERPGAAPEDAWPVAASA